MGMGFLDRAELAVLGLVELGLAALAVLRFADLVEFPTRRPVNFGARPDTSGCADRLQWCDRTGP